MATAKTLIIASIFEKRYSPETGVLSDPIVTLDDVATAISEFNMTTVGRKMSTNNPANFFKDFIRNRANANSNWPSVAFNAGYTAQQVTLNNACFKFIPMTVGQTEPFPEGIFARPTAETPKHQIESVSLPLASRRLGRKDEPWLIQVIARLRIVEAHFSLVSPRSIQQLDLLQMSVKLAGTEIDALFLAHEEVSPGVYEEVIVTCEAKGGRDDILEDQIVRQAKAPFSMKSIKQHRVIPIAVKCVSASLIHVVEFEQFTRETQTSTEHLTVSCDSLFEIKPPVPGICS